ncbi:MAG: PAS domain-containing protein [Candidatus Obscuribacterales bacterium]|nr:PAS domain-containing protein [Candidatus Obscuribacterales bacterium]
MGAKLNFAFIAIILVMALTQAGFSIFVDFTRARDKAKALVQPAVKNVNKELIDVYDRNSELANLIANDASFKQAISAKDRAAVAGIIKSYYDKAGFAGYGTIIQENGVVFYSSDSPAKFGYSTDPHQNKGLVGMALSGQPQQALCVLSTTGTPCLSFVTPIKIGNSIPAVLAVSTPFGGDLLQGMERKVKVTSDAKDFDLAFYVLPEHRVVACSPNLQNVRPSFLGTINATNNPNNIGETEADGRLWRPIPVWGPPMQGTPQKQAYGLIYVSAPIQNTTPNAFILLSQLGVAAGAALMLSLLFSSGLNQRFSTSMRFLKQRAKDLAANKQELPSLAVLDGDFLELAEMMDTALSSPRAIVQNLKTAVKEQNEEIIEKQRQIDAINSQLEMVNRQLSAHNRQSLEVSSQIETANRHAFQVQQKLAAIMQCSTEGFLILDPYGSVLDANPTVLNWLGMGEREVAGRLCFDLVRKPGERSNWGITFAHPGSGPGDLINQFFPEGTVFHRHQDKHVDVLMHLQPVVGDEQVVVGYIMVMRDKSLHSEVARLRNEIVTMLSQDIRAPLGAGEKIWNPVLNSQLQGASPPLTQNLLELHKIYLQMIGVVDSYLMIYGGYVPPQEEQTPREQVAVTRLIGECLEQVSQQARQQQIMLDYKTVTGLPTTAIHKEVAQELILKLLQKMISVTAPGGRVRAETTVKGKEIRLIISSSGPALQQVEIEEMFVGFIDGKHTEDTYQERLSLYLARSNAERLGGRIWAESEAGRGTAIFLTLPVH